MENRNIIATLEIIFGLLILIFPFIGEFTLAIVSGVAVLVLSIYLIIAGANTWETSKLASIAYLILGILGFIISIMLLGNIFLFSFIISFFLYFIGFILLFTGVIGLFTRTDRMTKSTAGLIFILGIIVLVLAYFALLNPLYLAIIIGIALVLDGIAVAIGITDE